MTNQKARGIRHRFPTLPHRVRPSRGKLSREITLHRLSSENPDPLQARPPGLIFRRLFTTRFKVITVYKRLHRVVRTIPCCELSDSKGTKNFNFFCFGSGKDICANWNHRKANYNSLLIVIWQTHLLCNQPNECYEMNNFNQPLRKKKSTEGSMTREKSTHEWIRS